MYSDCVDFVRHCEVCALRRSTKKGYATEVRARPTPARPFHTIALDIKGPLLTTDNNNSYILVVVCLLTRFVIAIPLPNTEGQTIARALVDHVFCIHGCPYNILTNQQHGVRKKRSVDSQLLLTLQDIASVLDEGEQIESFSSRLP